MLLVCWLSLIVGEDVWEDLGRISDNLLACFLRVTFDLWVYLTWVFYLNMSHYKLPSVWNLGEF